MSRCQENQLRGLGPSAPKAEKPRRGSMAGRNSQIARLYCALDLLEQSPQGLTVDELWKGITSRGHDAGKRTVYRDLEALSAAGFPLFPKGEPDSREENRWHLERNARVTDYLVLNARELLALYLAKGSLIPLKGTPFFGDLEIAFSKIEDKLGRSNQEYLNELEQEVKFQPSPKWGLGLDPDLLETVRAACTEGHQLRVSYLTAGSTEPRVRTLGPQYLYFYQSAIYLVAEDIGSAQIKVYALPRMKSAEMLPDPYEGQTISPETLFQHSIGIFQGSDPVEVRLGFSPQVAPYVQERSWHPSQRVVKKADGSIDLILEVAVTPELSQWVMSFGPNVKVESPNTTSLSN